MPEPKHPVDEWLRQLAERMQDDQKAGAAPKPERLSVREFLTKFGNARRGYRVVARIRRKLEKHHLRTTPDFEFRYIDNFISIEPDNERKAEDPEKILDSPTVCVDSLTAAHNNPVRVAPDDSLVRATTIMRMKDFSQLPVMTTDWEIKGVISWRSIGKAYVEGRNPQTVRDCMEESHETTISTTLVDATLEVWKHDCVLVRGEGNKITGIVTASDLALQFAQLSHPFLLIGEIEHHLRNLVRGRFTVEEFAAAAIGEKEVRGPDDLTFGDYCHLLGQERSWEKLNLNIDRKEFVKNLEDIRSIRNDVMHFSPDGTEPEDVEKLKHLARLFREL